MTVTVPTRMGGHFISQDARSKGGFVPEASLVLQAKKMSDYHDQMNAEIFERCFTNQLLPNIPSPSVNVMDKECILSPKINSQATHISQQQSYDTSGCKREGRSSARGHPEDRPPAPHKQTCFFYPQTMLPTRSLQITNMSSAPAPIPLPTKPY